MFVWMRTIRSWCHSWKCSKCDFVYHIFHWKLSMCDPVCSWSLFSAPNENKTTEVFKHGDWEKLTIWNFKCILLLERLFWVVNLGFLRRSRIKVRIFHILNAKSCIFSPLGAISGPKTKMFGPSPLQEKFE